MLLPAFAAFETAAGVFAAEFTVLAVEGAECVLALVPAGGALELAADDAVFFMGVDIKLDELTGCAFGAATLATVAGPADVGFDGERTSGAVVNTISTGVLGNA